MKLLGVPRGPSTVTIRDLILILTAQLSARYFAITLALRAYCPSLVSSVALRPLERLALSLQPCL